MEEKGFTKALNQYAALQESGHTLAFKHLVHEEKVILSTEERQGAGSDWKSKRICFSPAPPPGCWDQLKGLGERIL